MDRDFPPIDWEELEINVRGRTAGEVKTLCPRCSHTRKKQTEPCLNVNLDKNTFNCKHCGWAGPEPGYATERGLTGGGGGRGSGRSLRLPPRDREKKKVYTRPKPIEPKADTSRLAQFFAQRGISPETYNAFAIVEDHHSLCFPYLRDGELINVKHRWSVVDKATGERRKKFRMETGAELIFWNLDQVADAETVIIVEGEMDVLALAEAGITNVISPPNGAPALETDIEKADLSYLESGEAVLARARQVILAGDMDAPGRRLMDELARRIGRGKCWRVTWPEGCKDANEVLLSEGWQGGADGIRAALEMAEPYPVDGIKRPADYLDDLWKYEHDTEQGARISCWPHFAEMCRFSPGQLTILGGVPSSGKSAWLNTVMLDLALKHGWHIGIFSPEYHPPDLHVRDLVENVLNKPMNQKFAGTEYTVATREEVREAVGRITEQINFILPPEPTLDAVIERAQTLVYREGIKLLIIDPFSEIDQSERGTMTMTDWIDRCLKRLRRFGRDFGVHVVIAAHPKKMQMEVDREGTRKMPVVTPYDLSDSRHWYEMADVILSIWRDKALPDEPVQVHIQKVRFRDNGDLGVALFRYDRVTRRYYDVSAHYDQADYMVGG
jgi:twinkle protein